MSNAASLVQIVIVRSFPCVLAGRAEHVGPDVLTTWLLRRARLELRPPTIDARCDRYVLLTYVAVDLNVVRVDLAAGVKVRDGDSCDFGKLTLLIEDAIDGALEMITCAPDELVAGHRSSVRIDLSKWKPTRAATPPGNWMPALISATRRACTDWSKANSGTTTCGTPAASAAIRRVRPQLPPHP